MNKLTIIGNLTANPELKTTKDGTALCKFTVAVNRPSDKGVDYFPCTAWRGLAETIALYCDKGKKVAVNGSVAIDHVEYEDGSHRTFVNVDVTDVEFLSPKQAEEEPKPTAKKVVKR